MRHANFSGSRQAAARQLLAAAFTLAIALAMTCVLIALLGHDPRVALASLLGGAFGTVGNLNYTLYYSTSFAFAALAFSIPYRAGLFNIGCEGQAYIAGLGITLWCLYAAPSSPWLMIPGAMIAGALLAAALAIVPGWLHVTNRGNIVITTIMMNFVIYALMTFLILNFLIRPGQQSPESIRFAPSADLLRISDILSLLGMSVRAGPANVMLFGAIATAAAVHLLNQRTVFGFRLQVVGLSERAAAYAGIPQVRYAIAAMALSGVVSSLLAVNELLGVHHRLIQDFVSGYGFVGIAVALMARGHAIGILFSALLFGALYQGGTELSFRIPEISREIVVLVQGIVVFLVGALDSKAQALARRVVNGLATRHA